MLLDEICGEDRTGGERMEMNCGDGNTKRGFHAGVGPTKQAFGHLAMLLRVSQPLVDKWESDSVGVVRR